MDMFVLSTTTLNAGFTATLLRANSALLDLARLAVVDGVLVDMGVLVALGIIHLDQSTCKGALAAACRATRSTTLAHACQCIRQGQSGRQGTC